MIYALFSLFLILSLGLGLALSYELRVKLAGFFVGLIPQGKKRFQSARHFAQHINHAAAPEQLQSHWHIQQWWILVAGLFLFASILMFAFTSPVTPTKIEADYLKQSDPQIYALLDGQILSPPPEIEESLVAAAIVEASLLEQADLNNNSIQASALNYDPSIQDVHSTHSHDNLATADRKWHKMNPRYKQRLLMVFKIMREQHGYELVLLEGYRSPQRQNSLASNKNTTLARGYQSYHQFGLAADVAFKRDGKVVISERDPWAMRGYQLYGEVAESVGLTWGGRWKSIQDYGHTEFRMPNLKKTAEMAEKLTSEGQLSAANLS